MSRDNAQNISIKALENESAQLLNSRMPYIHSGGVEEGNGTTIKCQSAFINRVAPILRTAVEAVHCGPNSYVSDASPL